MEFHILITDLEEALFFHPLPITHFSIASSPQFRFPFPYYHLLQRSDARKYTAVFCET